MGSLEIGNSALPFSYFQVSSFWCVKTHMCVFLSLSQVTVHTANKVNKHKQASLSLAWTFDLKVVQMDMHIAYPSLMIQMDVLPTLIHILFYSEKKRE